MSQALDCIDRSMVIVTDEWRRRADGLVEQWLSGLAGTTQTAYRRELARFGAWWSTSLFSIDTAGLTNIVVAFLSCTKAQAYRVGRAYQAYLGDERGLAPKTIVRALACLRSLSREAHRSMDRMDWILDLRLPKARRRGDVRGPGVEALALLHEALVGQDDLFARRDRAVVALLVDQALRRDEVSSLDIEHLDLNAAKPGLWALRKGETERERLELAPETVGELRAWLDQRGEQDGPLFYRGAGRGRIVPKRLSGRGVWTLLRKRSAAAGIGPLRPHLVRHEVITWMAGQTDITLAELRDFAGHKSVTTTMGYVAVAKERRAELSARVAGLRTDTAADSTLVENEPTADDELSASVKGG